jgi:hypothetical protein
MLKPSLRNILFFLLLKYLVFFTYAMVASGNYKLLQIQNVKTAQDLFYYLWLVLFFPILSMIFFAWPLYFSFKLKSLVLFAITVLGIFFLEYVLYVYFTSTHHIDSKGVVNFLISVGLFVFFFYREIRNLSDKITN